MGLEMVPIIRCYGFMLKFMKKWLIGSREKANLVQMFAYKINFCQGNPGSITGINIFFFKQMGGVHKKKNGRLLEGQTYDEMLA